MAAFLFIFFLPGLLNSFFNECYFLFNNGMNICPKPLFIFIKMNRNEI